jgi:hypothetical protein
MHLIVFGATGMVGMQLIKQALFDGHHVKAFGRNVFTENLPEHENLELIKGALFDEGEVRNALKGVDAVLSALGGAFDGNDKTRSLGMKNIIAQMNKTKVHRIIGIGGLGVLNADENSLLIDQEGYPEQYIPVGKEHQKAWELLQDSNLEWTFVCPPDIIAAEATGVFTTNANYPPNPNHYRISAGDLALFMLKELDRKDYIHKRVGISN